MYAVNNSVFQIIEELKGEPCTRREVGERKSLSLGFGNLEEVTGRPRKRAYRKWELGTYDSTWRLVQNGAVLCGSDDSETSNELDLILENVELGGFASLRQSNDLDIRIELDNGVAVDILPAFREDDDCFHIFCPEDRYIGFSVRGGWRIGPSNKPWSDEPRTMKVPS